MGARHDAIPESIWQAIFAEVREGTSYAALARKWGPKVEKQFGIALSAAKISRAYQKRRGPYAKDPSVDFWAVIEQLHREVPAEVWEQLPKDGAEQHDHYIYGWPKRER